VSSPADAVDALLEMGIVPSFSRVGALVRRRTAQWADLGDIDLRGRTIVITGPTSGIGAAAARRLAAMGSDLVLLARNRERAERLAAELRRGAEGSVHVVLADMAEPDQVTRAAQEISGLVEVIDVLVHNAGALSATRQENSRGQEATVAAQVYGPFLLTGLLLDHLRRGAPGRVLTMSSGGMYTQPLTVSGLEMGPEDYSGSIAYARAKRAQVALSEMWAQRVPADEVVVHSLHPGWADTPGVQDSLPRFRAVLGPALRTPDEGADTLVWLASDDGEPTRGSGRFWHDRRPRRTHVLPSTRRSDTPERRNALWELCLQRSGLDAAVGDPTT
jgi:NAD(P)-dependent dehydrogenase (short-subunit alcohol dehydrogenase family)